MFRPVAWFLAASTALALAQQAPAPPAFTSPEVSAGRKITFRIHAPSAESMTLTGGDIPGNGKGAPMTKGDNGVWEVTLGPVVPGAYRYRFSTGGVPIVDPRNPAISESNDNVWSVAVVPGSETIDVREVPHGALASVYYKSQVLGRTRRMHVYTPPGYENGSAKYPVFYLLHGSSDSDDSWTSVGRANFILDNLIAAGRATPMIVVMPHGHTTRGVNRGSSEEFIREFQTDIMPYVEKHFRVQADRKSRAIAGLSMGGSQTLNIAVPNLEKFAYVGVFSSGVIGRRPGDTGAQPSQGWEEVNAKHLDNAAARKGLKLFWVGIGKDDAGLNRAQQTVAVLKKHGFDVKFSETEGAHTWLVWREYLQTVAPLLFR
jgi:enterochelin esterase family protein